MEPCDWVVNNHSTFHVFSLLNTIDKHCQNKLPLCSLRISRINMHRDSIMKFLLSFRLYYQFQKYYFLLKQSYNRNDLVQLYTCTVVHFYNLVYHVDATVSWTLAFYKTEQKSLVVSPLFATFINKTRSTVQVLKKTDILISAIPRNNTVHCYCLTNKLQIPCLRLVEMCLVNWISPTCMYCCSYTPHPSSRATREPAARKSIYPEC